MRNMWGIASCLIAALGCGGAPRGDGGGDPRYPPAVHTGEADLVCNIDSRADGMQKLTLQRGAGVEFDAVVSPIVDGTVALRGPDRGGSYEFTSHLARPARGTLTGVGDVDIETLETRVEVEVDRYQQEGGPGSAFSFTSADMAQRGIYVEFTGVARAKGGERYAFRVNFGTASAGSGKVQPADANDNSRIVAKAVMLRAPTTTVVQTTVKRLR